MLRRLVESGRVTAASSVQRMLGGEVTASLISIPQLMKTVRLFGQVTRRLMKEVKLVAKLRWRKD